MQTSWKYFWDWLNEYERSLQKSLLEFGQVESVNRNIQSKLELIKLLRNTFRD